MYIQQLDLEQLRVRLRDTGPDAPEGVGVEVLEVMVVARHGVMADDGKVHVRHEDGRDVRVIVGPGFVLRVDVRLGGVLAVGPGVAEVEAVVDYDHVPVGIGII